MRYGKQKEKTSTKAHKERGQTKEVASLGLPLCGGLSFDYRERSCFHSLNYLWLATT